MVAGGKSCYETMLWSRMGASYEKRRDNIEGVCKEDPMDGILKQAEPDSELRPSVYVGR